ncbi:MAG: ParA family protein [Pseudomonadota bacterium]
MRTIAFFNNKGGVGKTTLVFHLAWRLAESGRRIVVADLDPQANVTASFLDEDRLEELWGEEAEDGTIFGCVRPLMEGTGDILAARVEAISDNLGLIVGNLALSRFEDQLSDGWPRCADGDARAFRVISALWRVIAAAAHESRAEFVLIDMGPNLGAINRAALIAADAIAFPLAPDLYSLQGLRNLGPTIRTWRQQWQDRITRRASGPSLELPAGRMEPIGYIVMRHAVRLDRPVRAYDRWINAIPKQYRSSVLESPELAPEAAETDPYCLALLKHYASLLPLAQEARKPMFHLTAADGAIGSHAKAARDTARDFKALADRIVERLGAAVA